MNRICRGLLYNEGLMHVTQKLSHVMDSEVNYSLFRASRQKVNRDNLTGWVPIKPEFFTSIHLAQDKDTTGNVDRLDLLDMVDKSFITIFGGVGEWQHGREKRADTVAS